MEEAFDDANVVGDGHYTWAMKNFKDAHFYAPLPEPGEETEGRLRQLTQQQKKNNHELRRIRADVEAPFGWMKTTFYLLNHPFRESKQAQDYLVYFAASVWNRRRRETLDRQREEEEEEEEEDDD